MIEDDHNDVIDLRDHNVSDDLTYQIAYKTVGNADFFKSEAIRHTLLDCLDQRSIKTQVILKNVQIFNYGLSFVIAAPVTLDLHKFLMRTAQELINTVNRQYPELQLKRMAPSGVLSRLWHRPYYIRTLTGKHVIALDDYLA